MPVSVSLCRLPTDEKYASSPRLAYTGIFQAKHHVYLPATQYDGEGKPYRFQMHDGVELLCVTDGKGVLRLSDKEILMEQGDICFVNPYEPHVFSFDKACCERLCVVFFPRALLSGAYTLPNEAKALASGNVHLKHVLRAEDEGCREMRDRLLALTNACFAKTPCAPLMLHSAMLNLIACILDNGSCEAGDECSFVPTMVHKTIQYLDEHLFDEISSDTAARALGYTCAYFCRSFRKYFGKTFTSYIREARILTAKTILLQEPDILISELAFRVGFRDANYFSLLFRRSTGLSPSEFAKKAGNGERI